MNKKLNELYKKVNELMKASNNFDVKQYEEILHELESIIGKDVDRKDEEKMETELAENVQRTLLNILDGAATLDMVGIAEQIVTQAGGDYRALKTKYMNDGVTFFIDYLESEDTEKTKEKNDDKEEIYAEMQGALDKPEEDDGAE